MLVSARALAAALLAYAAALPAQNDRSASERPPEVWQLALGLQQRGLHDEAARRFAEFLRQEPRHELAAEAHYRLGSCQAELGQAEAARASLAKALQAGGLEFRLRPESRYRLGNLLEAAGKHQEAQEQFAALCAEAPADHYLQAGARYAEGECWREQGDDARAAAAFAAAVAAASGEQALFRFPALYQLGFAQLRAQDFASAARSFAGAADAAADDAQKGECLYLGGDASLRQRDFDAAEAAFRAAVRLPSEFADDARFGLGWVALGRGDAAAAAKAFAAFVERHADSPHVPRARLEIARIRYRDKQYAAAEEQLRSLLAGGAPADVQQQARELVGLCALGSGAGDEALAHLQQALAAAPAADKPRLSFALGEAFSNLKRWAEAVAAYDAVPADAPADLRGDALYGACFALHQLGRHEESNARAASLRRLQPPHRLAPQAAFAVAENQFALQKYDAAEAEYAALASASGAAGANLQQRAAWKLAWCRYLRGDKRAAAERFQAVAAASDSPFAEEALSMQALSLLEAGDADAALAAADQYRARHRDGRFLDRTERVAARVLQKRGDLAAASKRLERAAAVAAKSGDASADAAERAELAYQQGDFKAADALFAPLVERADAVGARACEGRAWCAFELGDDEACARWLARGLAHPAAGELAAGMLDLQCALQHRREDWPAAAVSAQEFLRRFPKHGKAPAVRYSLGVAQARGGDAGAARQTLASLAADGGYERADRVHYELAWACRRAGDEPAALRSFAAVAATSSDPELAGEANLHLGAAALERKDLPAARPLLTKVAGSHRGRALYRLAFAEFEAGNHAAARELFAAIAAIPGEALAPEARYLAAECCHWLGDHAAAVEHLEAMLHDAPQHERARRARLLLGECAVQAGDADVAVQALEPVLRDKELDRADQARAHLWSGRARMLRGEADRAEASLQRVTELSDGPLAAEAQFRLGENRAQRGDLNGAADAFVKLPILYAHEEWVRRGLLQAGLVYEQLQQPAKAQRFFAELIQRFPQSPEAAAARPHVRDDD